ncbi:alcohol dehydrogenase catalytic domain-containing protein [Actinokineospora spheciospongiae]|uniref:alcohol dehydrogenase catalytic domain-containing protein n=1 Tax=Actinokineospora spheciospongiae TaxID=909613 RepID=UPI000D717C2D|nr:alcohol dehydrogenase catalytic domain-containing protein [Actinokineospora spheciospongiae]PWW60279.1 alcohol dehydrogenase/L-iditol 2-dehydrogenase/propanol-preferring alcohol dehydrogenase [Actinokineospora spheciospongiae]
MTTMLAARAHRDADTIALERIPVPEPGPLDVVVRVAAAGLAPGMMRLLRSGAFKHLPTTLGHEAAGTVAAVGAGVTGTAVGDRVRVHPNLNCRDCPYCRTDRDMMCAQQAMIGHAAFGDAPMPLYDEYHDGGLAEYLRVPHWLVDPLPDRVNFDVGAKVHDLANAVRALKCADLPLGSTLVVTAATGTMGTATTKLAEHFGVSRLVLVGRDAERLHAVRSLAGRVATEVIALDDLPDWAGTGGLTRRLREVTPAGAHAVLDFIPDGPATGQAVAALATGGTLVHMGANRTALALPPAALMVNCWRFVGTRACTRTDAREVLRLLGTGALDVDELITQRFALADAPTAVEAMRRREHPMWMTVVHP